MINLKEPKTVRVSRAMCLESLEFHTRFFFWSQYKRKFIWNSHHQTIVDALEEVLLGRLKRLIINLAPRYSKTELAVKMFISHGLALNPAAKFIHLSYGDDIALDNSESIKDLLESEDYQNMFPGINIKWDSKGKKKWYTTQGGGLLARAAAGQVTGFGAGEVDEEFELMDFADMIARQKEEIGLSKLEQKLKFAGAIVIDDPIKPEDADMELQRTKVNSRFDSTIRNRVNSRNTPIILIQQRLHPEDLTGYLLRPNEPDQWRIISMPCLIENKEGEEVVLKDGTKKKYIALWPHKHTVEELLAIQSGNELVFGRQYQQNPAPKAGLLFPLEELEKFDMNAVDLSDPDFTLFAADPADEGGDDFAGGVTKLIGDKIYLVDVLYNTDGTDHNEVAIEELIMGGHYRVSDTIIEGVFGWKETATRIRERLTSKVTYGEKIYKNDFRIVKPRTNKHSRILNRSSFIKNHFRFRKDWAEYPQYAKFMRNLISYLRIQEPGKKNKHDDAPDLLEMKAAYYEKNFTHLWKPIK